MYRLARNTLPIVLTVYMALATAFSLTAVESWRAAGFTVNAAECSLAGGDSFIPPQTGALLTNTGEGTFFFARIGFQRGLSASGPQNTSRIFCQAFQVHSKINFINARNSILLKLRI
jgi:hypothetical protein